MTLSKEEKTKYLKILGLGSEASLEEIHNTYSQLRKLYASEISFFNSITAEFTSVKKKKILKELKDAYRKLSIQMKYEKSTQKKEGQRPAEVKISPEEGLRDEILSSSILQELQEQLDFEEKKLNQEYVRKIDDLMMKGTALMSSLYNIKQQLQNLERMIASDKRAHLTLLNNLNGLKSKVDEIQKAYSQNEKSAADYEWQAVTKERVGSLAEQIPRLRDSINQSQRAPTQTQINQFNGINRRVVDLFSVASEIMENDIPILNELLKEFHVPLIKI